MGDQNFTILIEQDQDGLYVASVPHLEGCYTQWRTLSEVLERIREAIIVCLEGDKEDVSPLRFVGIQNVNVEVPHLVKNG